MFVLLCFVVMWLYLFCSPLFRRSALVPPCCAVRACSFGCGLFRCVHAWFHYPTGQMNGKVVFGQGVGVAWFRKKDSSTEDNLNNSFLKVRIEEVGVWVGWGSSIPNLALPESQVEHRAWLYQTASLCIPSLGSNVKTITLNGGTVSAVCHYSKVDDPILFSAMARG